MKIPEPSPDGTRFLVVRRPVQSAPSINSCMTRTGAAYIPWDVGGLYYRHSSEAHRGLLADVIDQLLPGGRQLRTNAHPLVEMTVMEQPARRRSLIHLVNGTGHQDTAYFPPVEMRDIRIELASDVQRVQAVALGRTLLIEGTGQRRWFTLPRLQAYEVLVIE